MAEKLANVPGDQKEVPPSSAMETAGEMTQAIAAPAAAAGVRDPNFRACLFGCRAIAGPLFHADRQPQKAFGATTWHDLTWLDLTRLDSTWPRPASVTIAQ
jgi:hypothetical protein